MLGRPLFERQASKWHLPLGHVAKAKKRSVYCKTHSKLKWVSWAAFTERRALKLGASQTPAEHLVPTLISIIDNDSSRDANLARCTKYRCRYRWRIRLQIWFGCYRRALRRQPSSPRSVCTDHLTVVASAHHPFAKRERVSACLAQLEQAKWVLREHGSGTRKVFDSSIHHLIGDLDVWREYEHAFLF